MTILSFVLGILGLVATIIGTYITYISFINPLKRFKKYLRKNESWEQFQGMDNSISFYRYKKYPNFQLVIDWNKEVVKNFSQPWINESLYPDKTNNTSYFVFLEANSMLLDKELFVSLDGHRYFVPVPRTRVTSEKIVYFYDKKQIQLAKIVGKHHFEHDIYDFIDECKKEILIEN